jgi:HD-GYP domain-containing protein (c-di-GMP phosphodiesterase class II)
METGKKPQKSPFAVRTVDGQVLLPTGNQYSLEDIDAVLAGTRKKAYTSHSLFEYSSIKKDIEHFISIPPYQTIFADQQQRDAVLQIMKRVQLAEPILDSLNYFEKSDYHTYRHMLIIFALSILLARTLVPDGHEQLLEAAAGPTHDLGKVLVPLQILRKKDPLTRAEREVLEYHTTAGYVLLTHYFRGLENVAPQVARDHHERLNGSGYPLGIQQANRLVEIVSACDVYDALISPRPYRSSPYDNRAALEEVTVMAEQGEISWEVLQALVAFNRKTKPQHTDFKVSTEKRGTPPTDNSYGKIMPETD